MKSILAGFGLVLEGVVVVISLLVGAVVLIIATLLGKMQDFEV